MENKNPVWFVIGILIAIGGMAIFLFGPIRTSPNPLNNSIVNGAVGGLTMGLGIAMFMQKWRQS